MLWSDLLESETGNEDERSFPHLRWHFTTCRMSKNLYTFFIRASFGKGTIKRGYLEGNNSKNPTNNKR